MASPLYSLVRPVARYVLRYYFRKIEISGLEHIPDTGAVVFATNHPTAFIEPCLLACFQQRPLHFLARGNLYKNKLATVALRALNILPVYRIQDGGYGKLRENFGTFKECHRALSKRKAIMILAEGNCHHEKALRPLRKGTARIALGALDQDATLSEVYVIPVGINFTAADCVRTDVHLQCGPPILASEFLTAYRNNPSTALSDFTLHLRQRLNPLVVQFPNQRLAAAGEMMLAVAENLADGWFLNHQVATAAAVTDQHRAPAELAAHLQRTRNDLGAVAGAMAGMKSAQFAGHPVWLFIKTSLAVLALLPILPVWLFAQLIAVTQVNFIEFHSPVRFAAIAIGTIIFIPFYLIFGAVWWKIWTLLSLILVLPALKQFDRASTWYFLKRWEKTAAKDRALIRELFQRTREIVKSLPVDLDQEN